MGELIFVGLGLFDESDISLRGLEEMKKADFVYAEFHTSLMAGFSLEKIEKNAGKKITVVNRKMLEEESGERILQKAEKATVAFLVPGDPLIATTHVDLRIRAEKRGIKTRIVHGASIVSAAMGLSGLQNYRFGRSITIPFPEGGLISETPYSVIAENKARDLHTICFLDVKAKEQRYMTIREALQSLSAMEKKKRQRIVTMDSLAVGIARAGADDVAVKADNVEKLMTYNFGAPPHVLIISANRLHFMEAEALINLAHGPEFAREMVG